MGSDIRDQFARVEGVDAVDRLVGHLDPDVPFPAAASHMVRGHSGGPKPVKLPVGYLDDRESAGLPQEADVVISGG